MMGETSILTSMTYCRLLSALQKSRSTKKKKKKAKAKEESASTKRKYGKLVDDDEYLCPDGYVWKVDLPTPHKSFVESNLFAVRLPQSVSDLPHDRKTIYNFSDIETQEHCLNLVRVLGCGPGPRDSGKSTGSSASSENTIPGKKVETTCLVELLSNKIAGEKIILQVKRNDLIEIVDINNPKLVVVLSNTWQRLHIKNPEYEEVHAKYWDQRYRLFSRFDRGVRMDNESWYSVTPESISQHIAQHCLDVLTRTKVEMEHLASEKEKVARRTAALANAKSRREIMEVYADEFSENNVREGGSFEEKARKRGRKKDKIGLMLDLFCGSGGNTIPLAAVCEAVVAVDILPDRLLDARINAKVYGVENRIDFVCADAYDILKSLIPPVNPDGTPGVSKVDAVLLAPPWGGPDYSTYDQFDMSTGFPSGDGLELIKLAYKVSKNVICVFPKNIIETQVDELMVELEAECRVEEIFMYKKHKLSIIYIGDLS